MPWIFISKKNKYKELHMNMKRDTGVTAKFHQGHPQLGPLLATVKITTSLPKINKHLKRHHQEKNENNGVRCRMLREMELLQIQRWIVGKEGIEISTSAPELLSPSKEESKTGKVRN